MDFITEIFYNGAKSENGMMVMFYCGKYDSPIGSLWLTGKDSVLTGLSFAEIRGELVPGDFDTVKRWLDDYFRGFPRKIDFPMELSGTPFQKLVWNLLLDIPFSQTITYGQLAKRAADIMGRENMSAQAVGQAVGRNPVAIIVPCHRVVGSGGRLTGYAYGIEKKQWLLEHEQNRR